MASDNYSNSVPVEAKLVEASLKGDKKAFESLVRQYQSLVLNVVYRQVLDEEAAHDITQETFVKAYRRLATFDKRRSFKTWLLTIASNSAIDYLRARRPKLSLDEILAEEPYLEPSARDNPEEEVELTLFVDKLSKAAALLPLRYRQAFALRYQFDLTYSEISQVMNENENTVRTLLFRAKDRLAKLLASKDEMLPERKPPERKPPDKKTRDKNQP